MLTEKERAEVEHVRNLHEQASGEGWIENALDPQGVHRDRGALLRIIDRLSTQADPWRPVTETEPPDGVRVLAFWAIGNVYIAERGEEWLGDALIESWKCEWSKDAPAPSHWMPLPQKPGANHIGEPTAMVAEVARLREAIERLTGDEMERQILYLLGNEGLSRATVVTDSIMALLRGEWR